MQWDMQKRQCQNHTLLTWPPVMEAVPLINMKVCIGNNNNTYPDFVASKPDQCCLTMLLKGVSQLMSDDLCCLSMLLKGGLPAYV